MIKTPHLPRAVASFAFAILCAVLGSAYVTYLFAPAIGTFHDDGVYLVTAKALAEGNGYRIESLPGSPAQTKYPILFPWLVSLAWRAYPAFPDNAPWLRLVPLGAGIVWFVLSWRLLRRLGASTFIAVVALAMTAASPWTLFLSTTLLSETLFATLVTGALLVLLRVDREGGSQWDAFVCAALIGAAMLTRTAAVAPAAAGLLVLAGRRNFRAAATYGATLVVVAAPWLAWSIWHASDPIVDLFYSGANYTSWNIVFSYDWRDKLAVLAVNTLWATQVGQYWGLPFGSWPSWAAAAVCSVWIVRGLWLERRSPVVLVCVLYVGLLLVWAFLPVRFMVPLLPLLVWFLFVGAGKFRPLALGVLAVLCVNSSAATLRLAQATRERGGTWFDASQVDDWNGIRRLYQWVNDNTSEDAVLIATHDPTFYLFTGRRALRPDSLNPLLLYYNLRGHRIDADAEADQLRERMLRINANYVVVTPRDSPERIERILKRFPGSLGIVEGTVESRHAIYRVDQARLRGQ